MPGKRTTLVDRFWSKVDKTGECWEWRGAIAKSGYGHINRGRRGEGVIRCHRLSWELANQRSIPDGLYVLHKCDNPKCVRPDHLFLGTPTDNMRDMAAKGRWRNHISAGWRHTPTRSDL